MLYMDERAMARTVSTGADHNVHKAQGQTEADEETPLLVHTAAVPITDSDVAYATTTKPLAAHDEEDNSPEDDDDDDDEDEDDKPLPRLQLFLLCLTRTIEPIACFSIFPFINQMVKDNGHGTIPDTDIGFYSGLIESLFSVTQMMVMIAWGKASDRYGRKPILTISLFGLAVTVGLFGFARTVTEMVVFRCCAGVFAGTVVTIRAMVSEISTRRTQARAFSLFAVAGNIGIFAGPLVGGALATPASQYGGVFARHAFFTQFPYALSTLATAVLALVAAVLSLFFIQETQPPPRPSITTARATRGHEEDDTDADNDIESTVSTVKPSAPPAPSTLALLRYPGVPTVLVLYSYAMSLAFAYGAVIPVFLFTPVALGGYNFTPFLISLFMGLVGLAQAIWLLVVFPPLQRRIGTVGVLKWCGIFYPFFFVVYPLWNLLLRWSAARSSEPDAAAGAALFTSFTHHHQPSTSHEQNAAARGNANIAKILFWILTPTTTALGVGVSMAFTAVQLALNDINPPTGKKKNHSSSSTLATLNALALTLTSALRAITPAVFASLFAVGVRGQILGGHLVWVVMVVIAVGFGVAVRWLPERAWGLIISGRDK